MISPTMRVLAGYDGSPSAAAAIDVAAKLFPQAEATVAYLWTAPFADPALRARLAPRARNVDELIALVEREGGAEAERIARDGATLARAAGWNGAEPLVERAFGGEGFVLARLAGERDADVVVAGSRGLAGVRAILGSTSDLLVHGSTVPVVVIPSPLLADERDAAESGPIVVGYDGSKGSRQAVSTAAELFPGRELIVATAGGGDGQAPEPRDLTEAGAPEAEIVAIEARRGEHGTADALVHCAAQRRAGAVVVGSRGRSAAREILLGSVAMAVLHRAHRPVLVVPGGRYE